MRPCLYSSPLITVDSFQRGAETVALIAEAPDTYRLEARAAEANTFGRYEIRVKEVRAATLRDQERLAAERTAEQFENEGRRLFTRGSPEELKKAIDSRKQQSDTRDCDTRQPRRGICSF